MGFHDTHHEGYAVFPVEPVASWVLRRVLSTVLLLALFFTAAGCDVATDLFGSEESIATGGSDPGDTDSGGTDSGGTDSGGTDSGGTDSGGTDSGGTDSGGTDSGGTDSGGTDSGGTDSGGTDSGSTDSGDTGGTEPVFSLDLEWDPPTKNEDGTLLDDLAGYRVYDGPASDQYETITDVGNATQVTLHDMPAGTYYLTVTAYDLNGNESGFSNEIVVALE